jgi:single-strand DNA-binding protein
MASVNKVIIMGNCGRDTEVRYMPDGKAVANVSIATTSRRKDKSTGETIEDTQWHRVTFYERMAEIAGEYLKKGKPVYVEGRLKYGTYKDKTGIEKPTCDIVATEMQLLGGREEGQQAEAPRPAQRTAPAPAPKPSTGSGFDDMDDDIPF